jgi:hypothetical protein
MHTFGKVQRYVCTSVDVSIVRYAYVFNYGEVVWWWCLVYASFGGSSCGYRAMRYFAIVVITSSRQRASSGIRAFDTLAAYVHVGKDVFGEETMINNITGLMVGFECTG